MEDGLFYYILIYIYKSYPQNLFFIYKRVYFFRRLADLTLVPKFAKIEENHNI